MIYRACTEDQIVEQPCKVASGRARPSQGDPTL